MTLSGTNGNGNGNGHGAGTVASRLLLSLVRGPSIAVMRKYADWVEHTSEIEISGPGASYAGSAIYVCRAQDVPLVFLHRAHYDDRTLIHGNATADGLALFAYAAGLIVSRGHETPPELERGVRAGNGAIFIVGKFAGDDGEGKQQAELAAALAIRTNAPVIPLRAESDRAIRVASAGATMAWPGPRGNIRINYGPPTRFDATAIPTEAATRITSML